VHEAHGRQLRQLWQCAADALMVSETRQPLSMHSPQYSEHEPCVPQSMPGMHTWHEPPGWHVCRRSPPPVCRSLSPRSGVRVLRCDEKSVRRR
jgi:hypothetical protein